MVQSVLTSTRSVVFGVQDLKMSGDFQRAQRTQVETLFCQMREAEISPTILVLFCSHMVWKLEGD